MKIYIVTNEIVRANGERVTCIYYKAFADREEADEVKKETERYWLVYGEATTEVKELELVDEA